MSCPRKMVADILNNCVRPVRGNKPLAYWQYRNQISFTFDDNEITAISTVALGSFESAKFGLNAGHEVASSEIAEDAYKHKFSGIFTGTSADLDLMEDIVVFVQSVSGAWSCYGAKNGLYKEAQTKMANDNLSTVSVEFASREGMEEEYAEYVVASALVLAIPKTTEYEVITGLTITSGAVIPQIVYFGVETTKTGYAVMPDGSTLTSTAGLIDTTWAGAAGAVTLIKPKTSFATLSLSALKAAEFRGVLSSRTATVVSASYCQYITSIIADIATIINATDSPDLGSIYAPLAIEIQASGSGLTAVSIAAQLAATIVNIADLSSILFDFSGGVNAAHSTWSVQAKADAATIIAAGGTVSYNI